MNSNDKLANLVGKFYIKGLIRSKIMKSLIPKRAKSTFDENWVIDIRTLSTSVPIFQQEH